jgi:lysophospholipase L1-like esterase
MAIQTKTMVVKSDTALAETKTTIRDTVTFDTSKLPNGITYKGLKAVLSFADPIQWNKASTYDSLTVVWDDATHASYASKRPIPQNIELTNEFYWHRTADLDAQVEMYRQEVMQFDGRITANKQAIATETARAKGAEQTLEQFNQNLPNYKKGDTLVIIGDSWCYSGSDWTNGMGVIGKTIANALGIKKVNNVSVYGNGYVGNTGTYYNQLDNLNIDESDIALFIVFGSINDSGADSSKEGLKENIAKFITLFKKKYPNTVAHVFAIDSSYTMTPAMLRTSRNIIKAYTGEPNFIVHDSNYFSNRYPYSHDSMWTQDDVHPTTDGLKYFASNMIRSILGNCGSRYIINDTVKPGVESCTVINMNAGYIKFSVRFNQDVELNNQQNLGITEHGILPFESPTSYVLGSINLKDKKELRIEINQTTGGIIGTVIGYESPVTYPAGTYFEFTYNIL